MSIAGPGTSGTEAQRDAEYPSHTYLAPGTYTVSLTASGPGGQDTDTQTNYITVSAPSTDGIDQYTKLMLHFNGPNGSRTFTDSELTPKTVTGHGDAQISTAYSEFGGASLKLDGSRAPMYRRLRAPTGIFQGILPSISGGITQEGPKTQS